MIPQEASMQAVEESKGLISDGHALQLALGGVANLRIATEHLRIKLDRNCLSATTSKRSR